MDNTKIGKLICTLRKKKGMTQLQLAARMNISDKTVSKWERGLGCPDVSLLCELSDIFGVDLSALLNGRLDEGARLNGSMKKIKIYVCPVCGNAVFAFADTAVSCCGKKLAPSLPQKAQGAECLDVEKVENEYYVTSRHEMSKAHYISFLALLSDDTVTLRKLYPEWNLQTRLPLCHGRLVWYCNRHGLFYRDI